MGGEHHGVRAALQGGGRARRDAPRSARPTPGRPPPARRARGTVQRSRRGPTSCRRTTARPGTPRPSDGYSSNAAATSRPGRSGGQPVTGSTAVGNHTGRSPASASPDSGCGARSGPPARCHRAGRPRASWTWLAWVDPPVENRNQSAPQYRAARVSAAASAPAVSLTCRARRRAARRRRATGRGRRHRGPAPLVPRDGERRRRPRPTGRRTPTRRRTTAPHPIVQPHPPQTSALSHDRGAFTGWSRREAVEARQPAAHRRAPRVQTPSTSASVSAIAGTSVTNGGGPSTTLVSSTVAAGRQR